MACLDLRRVTVFTMFKILLTSRPPPHPPKAKQILHNFWKYQGLISGTQTFFTGHCLFCFNTNIFRCTASPGGWIITWASKNSLTKHFGFKGESRFTEIRSNVGLASSTPQETVPLQGCRGAQSGRMLAVEFPFERSRVWACGLCDLGRTPRGVCHLCHARARTGRNSNVPVTCITGRG